MEQTVELKDATEQGAGSVKVTIKATDTLITIGPEGHGTRPMEDDFNEVVLIENTNGQVRVFIWGDINQEDPTHIVGLKRARVDNRIEAEESGPGETHYYEFE